MGPGARVDPLAMIAEAKRLANPSQLVGQPVPQTYGYPSSYTAPYTPQPAPPANASPSSSTPATGSVITNPQSFVMPLGTGMPPPAHAAPNPYYSGVYAAARYPTAPYYSYHTQPSASYYPPPATAAPASTSTTATTPGPSSTPAPPTSTPSYSATQPAASTSSSSVGQQGSWSPEEEDRLRKLAEQSREQGGPQNKGEIEWDWVVQQWGNSRTRHQILLRATALGLKESSTRANKRKRETEAGATEGNDRAPTPASHAAVNTASAVPVATAAQSHTAHTQPTHTQPPTHSQTTIAPSATTTTPVSTHASPAMPPQRPPSSTTTQTTVAPARTTTNPSPATTASMPWSMPIVAANTPSPVLGSAQIEQQRATSYYRPQTTQRTSYGASAGASTTTSSHDVGRPDVNGHYGACAPNGQHMNQSSSGETVQVRCPTASAPCIPVVQAGAGSYSPASPVPYPGSQIYSGNVVPYGSSSLLGANVLPVSFHSPPAPQNATVPSQAQAPPLDHAPHDQSPRTPHTPTPGPSKRKSEDASSSVSGPRKRRQYVPIGSGLDGIERDEADLGPNGGPKHWTDSEKDSLFHWLLDSDKNWDLFRSKMNTVFRDVLLMMTTTTRVQAAAQVFGSRKSFTALKSCYHRNVETFKQIFAFEIFLSRNPDASGPVSGAASLGNFNDPTMARQVHLESRLDDARAAGIPVANLNVKVIDHWHQKGWYHLFKKRYVDDGTGQAVPFYGPTTMPFPDGPSTTQYANASIDPQLTNPQPMLQGDEDDEKDEEDEEPPDQHAHESAPHNASPLDVRGTGVSHVPDPNPNPNPASILAPPPQPERDRRSQPLTSRRSVPSFVNHRDPTAEQTQAQAQQTLDRLAEVTQALVEQMGALSAVIEQAKQTGVLGARREDGLNRKEKASLATEMLANPDVGEEVRRAAADYLKRLFMSE
ncbi:hypothetical protein DAEQUDRAFT_743343 [Daedalea quercina L-15889]|uniref:Myb-like domain-containing protein n=1 Tax=Daedalea quercina L-15889 TaxID=1314783 RepID=A0A165T9W4_9APHY|nr:hypothetical protein DAEQUDRAFT_743343 [Daedalea quercina L-15889]